MDIIAEFKALLAALAREKLEYAVCGGFAVNIHGYTRTTKDIDLLIRRESSEPMQQIASRLGFTMAGRKQDLADLEQLGAGDEAKDR